LVQEADADCYCSGYNRRMVRDEPYGCLERSKERMETMSDIMPNGHAPKSDWASEDWEIFQSWLRGLLHSNIVNVTFTKVDGTERTMKCTLNPEFLPAVPVTEAKKERKVSPTSIAVFEVDLKEWRSFRVADVKRIAFSLGDDQLRIGENSPFYGAQNRNYDK
jgi:hypothetical protein